jgi:DNA-binding response OmpR family regulator
MAGGAHDSARVLVVEDRRDTAELLTSVIRAAGFDARSCARATSVAEVIMEEEVAVLVVSFSGLGIAATTDLVGALRSRPESPLANAAVVALVDEEVDVLFGLGDAADAVLVRPVRADRLVDTITEVAATSAAARLLRRRPLREPLVQTVG